MNSLLLFLFLGASVALAELPFDDPALEEILNEEGEEFLGELQLADEENDPDRRPSRPPPVVRCFKRFRACLKKASGPIGKLRCLKSLKECLKRNRPTGPPPVVQCFVKFNVCFQKASGPKGKRLCAKALRACVKRNRPTRRPTRP